jgi:hypothetical protein
MQTTFPTNNAVHDESAERALVWIREQCSNGPDNIHLLFVRKHSADDYIIEGLLRIYS